MGEELIWKGDDELESPNEDYLSEDFGAGDEALWNGGSRQLQARVYTGRRRRGQCQPAPSERIPRRSSRAHESLNTLLRNTMNSARDHSAAHDAKASASFPELERRKLTL